MGPGNVFNIAPVEHPDVDGVCGLETHPCLSEQ